MHPLSDSDSTTSTSSSATAKYSVSSKTSGSSTAENISHSALSSFKGGENCHPTNKESTTKVLASISTLNQPQASPSYLDPLSPETLLTNTHHLYCLLLADEAKAKSQPVLRGMDDHMLVDRAESLDSRATSTFSLHPVDSTKKSTTLLSSGPSSVYHAPSNKRQRSPAHDVNDEILSRSKVDRATKKMKVGSEPSYEVGREWAKEFRALNRGKTRPTKEVGMKWHPNDGLSSLSTSQSLKHLSTLLEALEGYSLLATTGFLRVSPPLS
ncbi:hypothetical protein FRB94_009365 [Tulasnella sp. JGI-2019a]|nr:hypothetical protein FRB93_008756 [Tulasnella sp. JGI-2019a]KAG8995148.1 hypothetical protein FRB94_009365 [Tulasnella sp. JGI-2019a]KAG9026227.1 hypothetical protein FRB95_009065 [Tulasnella sp. JGI-2019a]